MFVTYQEFDDWQQEQGALILNWMLDEIGRENIHERDPADHRAI